MQFAHKTFSPSVCSETSSTAVATVANAPFIYAIASLLRTAIKRMTKCMAKSLWKIHRNACVSVCAWKKEKFVCMRNICAFRANWFRKNIHRRPVFLLFWSYEPFLDYQKHSHTHSHAERYIYTHSRPSERWPLCTTRILSSGLRGVILSQNRSI